MAQLVAMLRDAGLVEVHEDDEGREAYRLSPRTTFWVGNMPAIADASDAEDVLDALVPRGDEV